MNKVCIVSFVILTFCGAAFANEADMVDKAAIVLRETASSGIPHGLLDHAVCVGIVPSEIKAAFIFGGSYGHGILACRQHGNGAWGAPAAFFLGGGSWGLQIGAKSSDIVFLVMNESGARKLFQDHVRLGADASVAAGPIGRTAAGETDAELHTEILTYSHSKGLFAGVSLAGDYIRTDHHGNEELYGHPYTAREILYHHVVTHEPQAVVALDRELDRFSPHGGRSMAGL